MVFMCQRDSFLKEFKTAVCSCELIDDAKEIANAGIELPKENGSSTKVFRVVLEDTIIFPEGGGQPDDKGTINGMPVTRCVRKAEKALHYIIVNDSNDCTQNKEAQQVVEEPFKTGESVISKIDWPRRFDHMQQHSGQHLITAIADSLYGFSTTSWWLGTEDSYIEMDTLDISSEQMKNIEDEVNAKIRECIPVSVDEVEPGDPKLKTARENNLPEDVKGQIRIVTISGIESDVCCGTHVTNLSQLQVIKLLHVIKKRGKSLLHFLCGNRVIHSFSQLFQREQQLMGLLKASPTELPSAAEKLNVAVKSARKSCQVLSKDLAALEAKKLTECETMPKLVAYHRDNVDLDFAFALLREIGPVKNYCLLITVKTEGSSGHMMLVGDMAKEKLVSLGESLCGVLEGKGNARGNVYQAKVNKINNVKKAVKLAEDLIESL